MTTTSTTLQPSRIESIDLLRGIVMILMALDHVRDYFHADAFLYSPLDLTKTSVPLYFTRWITHYCAPVFVFLSGTSAFLVGMRKGKKELSLFLLKRGLWLVFLELTVVNIGWYFNFTFPVVSLFVIWALGVGMIVLAGAIHLPLKAILVVAVILVAGHNVLDGYHVEGEGPSAILWAILHEFHIFPLGESRQLFVGYPIIAWTGVMLLGYCFGKLYEPSYDPQRRKSRLVYTGIGFIFLFLIIRLANGYGDPRPWSCQPDTTFTILSFLNVTKYPPSLAYVLVTLGPALLLLAISEHVATFLKGVVTIGRVPMFYYLLHIYLIHLLAMVAAMLTGYSASDMIFSSWVTDSGLKGYGFSLGITYLVWIVVVAMLYPLCKWYDAYKSNHREKWWLSYL